MKIRDAKQAYAAHRSDLWKKREALAKVLKEREQHTLTSSAFDRVELSRELSLIDAQYDAVDKALMGITAMETKVFGDECNRHQAETQAKMAEEMGKIKIPLAAGDSVEQQDDGMRPRPSGGVKDRKQPPPSAGNQGAVNIRTIVGALTMGCRS